MKKLERPAGLPDEVASSFAKIHSQFRRMAFTHLGRSYSLLYHADRLRNPTTRYGVDFAVTERPIHCIIESEGKPAAYLTFTQFRFALPDDDEEDADDFLMNAADAHSQAIYEIAYALQRKNNLSEVLPYGDILECMFAYTLPGQPTDGFWIAGIGALLKRISGLASGTLAFETYPIEYAGLHDREDIADLTPAFERRKMAMRRLYARSISHYCQYTAVISGNWMFVPLNSLKQRYRRKMAA